MEFLTSRDVQAYLLHNDMVVLPVGCFEMHGPNVPLACDSFCAWASAILLAERWGCLSAPPVFYTYPGATGPWPGTVDMPVDVTQRYVSEVACALVRNGFGRVVICGTHGPLDWMLHAVVRDIFQKSGTVVLYLSPRLLPEEVMVKELGYGWGEDIFTLAALRILGMEEAAGPVSKVDKHQPPSTESMRALQAMRMRMPWTYTGGYQHVPARKAVRKGHAEKAVRIMKRATAQYRDVPDLFRQYQTDMKEMYARRPWEKAQVWT
jgi:creatinine amidohydrolase/Fe(II)-dependent formamide hydrolase-like protein